jgi:hypothetical protein
MGDTHATSLLCGNDTLPSANQYDGVLTEPLPRRWVDLIYSLDQQERDTRGHDRDHDSETSLETECGSAFLHGPTGGRSR